MRKYVHALSTDRAIHARAAVGAEYWPTPAPAPVGAWPPQQGGRNYVYLQYRRINALGHIRVESFPARPPAWGARALASALLPGWPGPIPLPRYPVTPLPRYPGTGYGFGGRFAIGDRSSPCLAAAGSFLGSLDPLYDSGQVALVLCTREQAQCGCIDIESNHHSDPHLRSPLPCSYAGFLNCCLDVARG
ncbi:Uncharacterised protein [Mycobacteroides abscessus subsp. abscessus]|nr:Uncharacterised protein [Mycobacteroides abscessus subsp. abscessus]